MLSRGEGRANPAGLKLDLLPVDSPICGSDRRIREVHATGNKDHQEFSIVPHAFSFFFVNLVLAQGAAGWGENDFSG